MRSILLFLLVSLFLVIAREGASAAAQVPQDGLILDLNADTGVTVEEDNRVIKWVNQVSSAGARDFVKRDKGREVAGSGRPTLKESVAAIGGHDAIAFHRQELLNNEEDAFDHLITGSGYTWFAVLAVYPQVPVLKDVNSFFGNLRNGGNYEGFWAGLTDDNKLWAGTRNGITFGRWDENNPKVLGPKLEEDRYYVLGGRMESGRGTARIDLFINKPEPVASETVPVNPEANASKMAIGQERDATNHPGAESFDGELTRFLIYERPLVEEELQETLETLMEEYEIELGPR